MRVLLAVTAAAAVLLPAAAAAQMSHRSIALEAGIAGELGGKGRGAGAAGLCATAWLDGPAEAFARLSLGSARATGGRGADFWSGTVGVRLSAGSGPVRPQVEAGAGWARIGGGGSDRIAWSLGAGLEWFPALDLSLALRAGIRGAGGAAAAEAAVAATAYF